MRGRRSTAAMSTVGFAFDSDRHRAYRYSNNALDNGADGGHPWLVLDRHEEER
jgi:hypothetical protein